MIEYGVWLILPREWNEKDMEVSSRIDRKFLYEQYKRFGNLHEVFLGFRLLFGGYNFRKFSTTRDGGYIFIYSRGKESLLFVNKMCQMRSKQQIEKGRQTSIKTNLQSGFLRT